MEFFVWAHRGASHLAPENTLAAFERAEEDGADGIELDVHLSREGVPVVIHDERLERTTDGRGAVRSVQLRQLQRLDAGSWFGSAYAGEGIPTLDEVLGRVGDRLRLNIEIKSAEAGKAVLQLLEAHPEARVLVSSFHYRLLARLRQQSSELPLGVVCDSRLWRFHLRRAIALQAESFHPREDLVSRPMLCACKEAGLKVYPWTVDDPVRAQNLRRAGVDGLFSNDPAAVRTALF